MSAGCVVLSCLACTEHQPFLRHAVKQVPPPRIQYSETGHQVFPKNTMSISNGKVLLTPENKDRGPAAVSLRLGMFCLGLVLGLAGGMFSHHYEPFA